MSDSESNHIIINIHDDEKDSTLTTTSVSSSSSHETETVSVSVSQVETPSTESETPSTETDTPSTESNEVIVAEKPRLSIGSKTSDLSSVSRDIYSSLFQVLTSDSDVENIINNKLKISLDEGVKKSIFKILLLLTNNNSSFVSPLKDIVKNLEEILADGKIDIHDIPVMVKIMTDILNLNKDTFQKISVTDLSLVLKIIILSLVETGIISQSEEKNDLIMRLIDSSLTLLNTTLQIKDIKCNKWFACCK